MKTNSERLDDGSATVTPSGDKNAVEVAKRLTAGHPEEDCPFCHGTGNLVTFDHGVFECSRCQGGGRIKRRDPKAVAAGKLHRDERIERRETLRDCARRLGIGVEELMLMEKGIK